VFDSLTTINYKMHVSDCIF